MLKSLVTDARIQKTSVGVRYLSANYQEQPTGTFALLENGSFPPIIKRDLTICKIRLLQANDNISSAKYTFVWFVLTMHK